MRSRGVDAEHMSLHRCTEDDVKSRFEAPTTDQVAQLLTMHCLDDPSSMPGLHGDFVNDLLSSSIMINLSYCTGKEYCKSTSEIEEWISD